MSHTRTATPWLFLFLLLAFVLACGGPSADGEDESGSSADKDSLVDHDLWHKVDAAEDVFGDRPASPFCPFGWTPELFDGNNSLSVNTDTCQYLTVRQASRLEVLTGERVKVRLYHFDLESLDPAAQAHLGVALDGQVIWETDIAIPTTGAYVEGTFTAPRDFPVGTPVDFHLHNHGPNSYSLLRIKRLEGP
ncbi:MAG: hypothetical protein GY944_02740 [bacterium]|nr:hypothetical protein [bacterium]